MSSTRCRNCKPGGSIQGWNTAARTGRRLESMKKFPPASPPPILPVSVPPPFLPSYLSLLSMMVEKQWSVKAGHNQWNHQEEEEEGGRRRKKEEERGSTMEERKETPHKDKNNWKEEEEPHLKWSKTPTRPPTSSSSSPSPVTTWAIPSSRLGSIEVGPEVAFWE